MGWDDERVREHVQRLEGLLDGLDPGAHQAVQSLVELYGEALDRIVRLAADASALAGDELVGHLLVMHGLHPETPDVRVRRALAALEGFLAKHRTSVEFAGIDGEAVRLKVATEGRAAASRPVLDAVERAALAAAPELERVEIEAPAPEKVLITLDQVRSRV
ncbi:NifU family protein [Actinomadura sp. WMMA1423]|uniref:NifU family protein n=1 Tax=Actinomadura sp. WMMA1423 TaxID=2591108 RepID=UPI0011465715|nr:NifU family protein [Actinomadura sp. WMMA1423]